ncbi:MAG TPA: Fic family protein [Candidatus Babeliales bacterium]|nr:Fic family protein [Candidatus Babeliales bacterium]
MIFLTVDDICRLHDSAINTFGGLAGIRDHGLLESAAAQPQSCRMLWTIQRTNSRIL